MTDLSNDNEDLMSTDIYVLSSVTIIKFYYIVGSLSAKNGKSVIFRTKVPNLQGWLGRVWEAIFLMAPRWHFIILCFVHHFQNGGYLPCLEPF